MSLFMSPILSSKNVNIRLLQKNDLLAEVESVIEENIFLFWKAFFDYY